MGFLKHTNNLQNTLSFKISIIISLMIQKRIIKVNKSSVAIIISLNVLYNYLCAPKSTWNFFTRWAKFILPQFSYSNLLPITIMFPILFILALNATSQCSLLVDTGGSHFNEIKVMIATFNPLNFVIAL